jgi:hypothetical protein
MAGTGSRDPVPSHFPFPVNSLPTRWAVTTTAAVRIGEMVRIGCSLQLRRAGHRREHAEVRRSARSDRSWAQRFLTHHLDHFAVQPGGDSQLDLDAMPGSGASRAEAQLTGRRSRGKRYLLANPDAEPRSPVCAQHGETNPAESCSLRRRRKFLGSRLQCASFLFIKKKKGGVLMKIKVHVRAGGPLKAR